MCTPTRRWRARAMPRASSASCASGCSNPSPRPPRPPSGRALCCRRAAASSLNSRISAARAFWIGKAKREKASLLIAHLERTRDSRFNRDRFILKDASGSVPIEFEFEDVGLDDVAAYFGELERKIEESPTTYLVALTAWRTLCEGIERDNTGCDDDAFAHSRTRICARLNDVIFLDERIFAHSQNNICARVYLYF